MAVRGKTITLFLMDGEASGRIKCTLANWTGVAHKIPRTELDKCKERDELKQSGVYFLFGKDDKTDADVVYIGQAGSRQNGEGILFRLQEHKRDPNKGYWTEAVVFTTSNNSFGSTEISYLENRFCDIAKKAKHYLVKNGNSPTAGNITEEKESELEEFIDYARIIMGTLGYKVFDPLLASPKIIEPSDETVSEELLLFLKRKSRKSDKTLEARCNQTSEGFVLLSGSTIEMVDSESIPVGVRLMREQAKIDAIDAEGNLQKNILFNSPSYAASFVVGGHANGLTEWKTSDGKTLKDYENQKN